MIVSGSSLWSPLASVIAFGLLGSMFFTLVAIPVLFVVVHRKARGGSSGKSRCRVAAVVCAYRRCARRDAAHHAGGGRRPGHQAELDRQAGAPQGKGDAGSRGRGARQLLPVLSNESDAAHLRSIEHMGNPRWEPWAVYSGPRPVPGTNTSLPLGRHDFLLSTTTAGFSRLPSGSRFTPE